MERQKYHHNGHETQNPDLALSAAKVIATGMMAPNTKTRTTEELDLVRLYLDSLDQYPVLTPEQEKDAFKRYHIGIRAATQLHRHGYDVFFMKKKDRPDRDHVMVHLQKTDKQRKDLDETKKRALAKLAQDGENDRQHIYRSNLKWVVTIAKNYIGRGVPFLDLIMEGNQKLERAIEKFDLKKENKFSTYAFWWIKQGILIAINKQRKSIRSSKYQLMQIGFVNDIRYKYFGDRVDIKEWIRLIREEAKALFDISNPQRRAYLSALRKITDAKLAELLQASQKPISLDSWTGDEERETMAERIPDVNWQRPYLQVETQIDLERIFKDVGLDREQLSLLNERERSILYLRFHENITLEEIGEMYHLTKEAIRQIEKRALEKLRSVLKEAKDRVVSLQY